MLEPTLRYQIKTSIESLKKNAFQDFMDTLLLKVYKENYIPMRQYRDKGCDGIINNNRVIACYSPENPQLASFRTKIDADHKGYVGNWQKDYPEFFFVYNGEYTAEMVLYCDGVSRNIGKWGLSHILAFLDELQYRPLRDIVEYLQVDIQYFNFDVLKHVVDDMVKDSSASQFKYKNIPPDIVEKIKTNYKPEDVENAIKDYENIVEHLAVLQNVLSSGYSDEDISALKTRVLTAFDESAGEFKEKITTTIERLGTGRERDDIYQYYIRVVVIYFFETCLLGKEPKSK